MSRYLLVTDDREFEVHVRNVLGLRNGELRLLDATNRVSPEHLTVNLTDLDDDAEVIAIGPGLHEQDALLLAQRLGDERPEISVLIVAAPTAALWEHALQVGARGVVAPDASGPQLLEAFTRASAVARRLRQNLTGDDALAADHKVIAVASPKGGTGKTTVSTNLAVALALGAPHEVVVVDADLQFGDIASALGITPAHSIADAAAALPDLDLMTLKVFLQPHNSGLFALCGAATPQEGERITPDALEQLLRLLTSTFRFVVVDTPAGLTEHTLSVLEHATDIVQVCSMDLASLRAMSKEAAALDTLCMGARRHLVLNRADSRVGMSVDDVEQTLVSTVDVSVPSSRSIPMSINLGQPLVQVDSSSRVAREFFTLAARFNDQPVALPRAFRSLLRRNS